MSRYAPNRQDRDAAVWHFGGILGRRLGTTLAAIALVVLEATDAAPVHAEFSRVQQAHEAILELDLARARELLHDADDSDPASLVERARLALYEANYDHAAAILSRPEVARTDDGAELAAIAGGCARATAGAISTTDEPNGVFVRFQDEGDRVLLPMLVSVAVRAREALARDLRVDLPRPLHIEVVRDLFTLSAMTGLAESAAQTTGTVAVAKWGRVTLLSPRAVPHGYPWADTLAHELAHLAQSRATADRAPLWLQEGVAKREETRWRSPRPLDDFPGSDVIAAVGLERGLGRPIDKLGASIAMLPSPEHAMVAFAEVTSFVRFFGEQTGEQALPELLAKLHEASGEGAVDAAMKAVTGASLTEWNARWLHHLSAIPRNLPADSPLGGRATRDSTLRRDFRLGELLRGRDHQRAAERVLGPAQKLAPFDPLLRYHLASALYALGRTEDADALVSKLEEVHSEFGPWMALHARRLDSGGHPSEAEEARNVGVELSPYDLEVACEGKMPPERPHQPERAELCDEARTFPRE